MSRRTRTTLPICKQLLRPTAKATTKVKSELQKRRTTQKRYYDKTSKPLTPLAPNQVVRLQTTKGYDKVGIVKKKCTEPRSYVVESEGKEYRRNRRHILPARSHNLHTPRTWTCHSAHLSRQSTKRHYTHLSRRSTKHHCLKRQYQSHATMNQTKKRLLARC